jgi:hypothetical protein
MGRFLFPLLLIGLGIVGLMEHDAINNQWNDMYPEDTARQNALTRCAEEDSTFNRFSAAGRASCYQKYMETGLPPAAPGIVVGIPGGHAVPRAPPMRTNTNQR